LGESVSGKIRQQILKPGFLGNGKGSLDSAKTPQGANEGKTSRIDSLFLATAAPNAGGFKLNSLRLQGPPVVHKVDARALGQ